ncbi:MAG: hypothetical protein Q8J62_01150, partial [Candidatus Cloacimonadaceae bacterium]|nr:hypothetical protein [Candidatus Cloacimonadaceae bacterium]
QLVVNACATGSFACYCLSSKKHGSTKKTVAKDVKPLIRLVVLILDTMRTFSAISLYIYQ